MLFQGMLEDAMTESEIDEMLNVSEEKQNLAVSDEEIILAVASRILEEHKAAFLELAK